MKRILAVFVLTAASIVLVPRSAIAQGRTASVEIPSVACSLGLCGATPISVSLSPQLPFYGRVVMPRGRSIIDVASCVPPGTSLYNRRHTEGPYTELSVGVLLYSDSLCANLVGVAGDVLRITRGQVANFEVVLNRVRRLDGAYSNPAIGISPYPPISAGTSRRADFPRLTLSEQPILVLNGTNYSAIVFENDREALRLVPGGVGLIYHWLLYDGSTPASVRVVFLNRYGDAVGCYTQHITLIFFGKRLQIVAVKIR